MAMALAKRPNWPLRVFLGVSLLVHLGLILHVSGLLDVRAYSVIRVGLMDPAPPARSLPRPRLRPPQTNEPQAANPLEVRRNPLPMPQPQEVTPLPADARDVMAEAAPAAVAGLGGVGLAAPSPPVGRADQEAYYETVRWRIEREKRYPSQARRRQIEGRVALSFAIGPKGELSECRVTRGSGSPELDQAALEAVKRASPFPAPPTGMIKPGGHGLRLELTVAFVLS
jgi:protein TonB